MEFEVRNGLEETDARCSPRCQVLRNRVASEISTSLSRASASLYQTPTLAYHRPRLVIPLSSSNLLYPIILLRSLTQAGFSCESHRCSTRLRKYRLDTSLLPLLCLLSPERESRSHCPRYFPPLSLVLCREAQPELELQPASAGNNIATQTSRQSFQKAYTRNKHGKTCIALHTPNPEIFLRRRSVHTAQTRDHYSCHSRYTSPPVQRFPRTRMFL